MVLRSCRKISSKFFGSRSGKKIDIFK